MQLEQEIWNRKHNNPTWEDDIAMCKILALKWQITALVSGTMEQNVKHVPVDLVVKEKWLRKTGVTIVYLVEDHHISQRPIDAYIVVISLKNSVYIYRLNKHLGMLQDAQQPLPKLSFSI